MIGSLIAEIKKLKYIAFALLGIYSLIGIGLLLSGPKVSPDGTSYIGMEIIRGPYYALFINLFKSIFNTSYYLYAVIIFQILLNLSIGLAFALYLYKKFNLSKLAFLMISICLLYPIYDYSIKILTEALAVPLFYLFIVFFIESVTKKQNKLYLFSLLILLNLILLRSQFLFIIPVVIIFSLLNDKIIQIIKTFTIIIVLLISTNLVDKFYHYYFHGSFMSTPFTGIQFLTNSIYVSDESKLYYIISESDRETIKSIFVAAEDMNLTLRSNQKLHPKYGNTDKIYHYVNSYNDLAHRTIRPIMMKNNGTIENFKNLHDLDKKAMEYSLLLIRNNWFAYIKLCFFNIKVNWFHTYLIMLLFTFVFLLTSYNYIKYKDFFSAFAFMSFTLTFANLTLIALVEPVFERYTIYSDMLLVICLIALCDKYYTKREINK